MKWGESRDYSYGLDRGIFFPSATLGVPWNGLRAVEDNTDDADEEVIYVDGIPTRLRTRRGEFAGTIEAFTYPTELYGEALWKKGPKSFGMSYRVMTSRAYQIHLVYNVFLGPEGTAHGQEVVEPFRWTFSSMPVEVPDALPSAHLIVDTGTAYSWTVAAFEDILYGTESSDSRLPSPHEVYDIFEQNAIVRVTDNGDGSFTVEGPDYAVYMLDGTSFEIDWPSAVYQSEDTYTIHSL